MTLESFLWGCLIFFVILQDFLFCEVKKFRKIFRFGTYEIQQISQNTKFNKFRIIQNSTNFAKYKIQPISQNTKFNKFRKIQNSTNFAKYKIQQISQNSKFNKFRKIQNSTNFAGKTKEIAKRILNSYEISFCNKKFIFHVPLNLRFSLTFPESRTFMTLESFLWGCLILVGVLITWSCNRILYKSSIWGGGWTGWQVF